jgi:integrase
LAALPQATTARNVVLPEATIGLLVRAAREQNAEFGLLVETLALTGARVSQLARCQIRDSVGERLRAEPRRRSRWRSPIGCG